MVTLRLLGIDDKPVTNLWESDGDIPVHIGTHFDAKIRPRSFCRVSGEHISRSVLSMWRRLS